jgi:hypothetical protein
MTVQLLNSSHTLHYIHYTYMVLEMRFIFLDIQWNSDIGILVIHITRRRNFIAFRQPKFYLLPTLSCEVFFIIHLLGSTLSPLFLRFTVSGLTVGNHK